MTNNDELALKLKAAAEKATALNLDSAEIQRGDDGYYECPVCCGEGEVEAKTDFCNIDGVALGVQFYGIGEHHGAAEEYFRTVSPTNILSLLSERTTDKAENASLRQRVAELEDLLEKSQSQSSKWLEAYHKAVSIGARYEERIAELEARTVSVKLPPRAPENLASVLDGYEKWLVATTFRDTWNACLAEVTRVNAAGIKLEVGE